LDGYIYKFAVGEYPPNQQTHVITEENYMQVGQRRVPSGQGYFYKYRGYVSFSTGSIPIEAYIMSARLLLKIASMVAPDPNFELRVMGGSQPIYGNSLDASDWNAGNSIIATWNTANYPGKDHYISIPIAASQINRNGRTQFRLVSNRDVQNTYPSLTEAITFYSGDSLGNEPILEVILDWRQEKPASTVTIDERVDTATVSSDGTSGVGLGVEVAHYLVQPDYNDIAWLRLVATANTRENLDYQPPWRTNYAWVELVDYIEVTGSGDDWIQEVDLDDVPGYGFDFLRFYGLPGSGEYESIGVSSNGFITFDPDAAADKYYGRSIPDPEGPDCFAAPFWTDLRPTLGGSIKIGFATYLEGSFWIDSLVVTWDGVPNKYGVPQTFQVGIGHWLSLTAGFRPAPVWFQLKDITFDDYVTIGIESPHGAKGHEINPGTVSSETAILFPEYESSVPDYRYAFITALNITVVKNGENSIINFIEDSDSIRGVNVQWIDEEPDPQVQFANAMFGKTALLIGGSLVGLAFGPVAGLMFGAIPIAYMAYEYAASQMSQAEPEDWVDHGEVNYGRVEVRERPPPWPFYPATYSDAWFGINVFWEMPDPFQDSSIEIFATLEYFTCGPTGAGRVDKKVTTDPVILTFAARDPVLSISSTTGGTTSPSLGIYSYSYGSPATVTASVYSYYVFDYWNLDGETVYGNPITVTMDSDHDLRAHFRYTGGGGGCPMLSVWDGSDYVNEGLLDIHNPDGIDVVTTHYLATTPKRDHVWYSMRLTEHPQTISHIDQVKLYATFEDGKMIRLPLIWAQHSEGGNALPYLLLSDERKIDLLGADHNGGMSQTIDLRFWAPRYLDRLNVTGYIFQIEGHNRIMKY